MKPVTLNEQLEQALDRIEELERVVRLLSGPLPPPKRLYRGLDVHFERAALLTTAADETAPAAGGGGAFSEGGQ